MPKVTKPQAQALLRVFSRNDPMPNHPLNVRAWWRRYIQFRRSVVHASYDRCIMVHWCGMWLGIEPDGYTHS